MREKVLDFGLKRAYIVKLSDWGAERDIDLSTFEKKLGWLEKIARGAGYGHVVIDPLGRIAGVTDEAGTELGQRVDEAAQMAQRAGIAITLIHHQNKGTGRSALDRMRGSTTLTAAVDTIVQIDPFSKKQNKPRARKLTALGRVRESNWEKVVTLNDDSRSYTVPEQVEEHAYDRLALKEAGVVTVEKFCTDSLRMEATPANVKTARKRLTSLVDQEVAEKHKDGNDPATYRVVP